MHHLRKPIGPVIDETKSRENNITKTSRSQNFTNKFTTQFSRHYNYMMLYLQELSIINGFSSEYQWGFLYERTTSNDNKKKSETLTVEKYRNFFL